MAVQGQTVQGSVLLEYSIQMFCAESDYGDRKEETESGIQIAKDLGVGAGGGLLSFPKMQ